ncbi:hypothetical protein IQ251_08940 [Saccharopolyspora sp. HNM0983]|uniref:Uncharacterized protein n=1 Tax=Saccharopolyspora montiporae TaxID=2781240 RepID=A0A929G1D7_9PSEU|nr:hypothetical protein [Saccharopolyspora sp. HNM0983]MBE9374573.1 hypothetical protein [Saccharopolyspora sp. HNM0983]
MTHPTPPPRGQPHYPAQPDEQRLREGPPPTRVDEFAVVAFATPVV